MFKDAYMQEAIVDQVRAVEFDMESTAEAEVGSLLGSVTEVPSGFERIADEDEEPQQQPARTEERPRRKSRRQVRRRAKDRAKRQKRARPKPQKPTSRRRKPAKAKAAKGKVDSRQIEKSR